MTFLRQETLSTFFLVLALVYSLSTPDVSADDRATSVSVGLERTSANPSPKKISAAQDSPPMAPEHEPAYSVIFTFDYQTPLSLYDAIRLTYRVRNMLNPADKQFLPMRREKAIEVLDVIVDYIKQVDDRHSLLPYYRWYTVGEKRVSVGVLDEDNYELDPIHYGVSALSFVALRGDVYVQNISVIDKSNSETRFNVNRWVRVDFPRKEVCYLYFPTDIRKIIIRYTGEQGLPEMPKLQVFSGVTNIPEHGKAALYYLSRARQLLASNAEFPETVDALTAAIDVLIKFKNSRRL